MSRHLQRARGISSGTYSNKPTYKMMFKAGIGGRIAPGVGMIRHRSYEGGPRSIFVRMKPIFR